MTLLLLMNLGFAGGGVAAVNAGALLLVADVSLTRLVLVDASLAVLTLTDRPVTAVTIADTLLVTT